MFTKPVNPDFLDVTFEKALAQMTYIARSKGLLDCLVYEACWLWHVLGMKVDVNGDEYDGTIELTVLIPEKQDSALDLIVEMTKLAQRCAPGAYKELTDFGDCYFESNAGITLMDTLTLRIRDQLIAKNYYFNSLHWYDEGALDADPLSPLTLL
ncbi:hypothetical protein A3715_10485 [Oleiphilus sp. HI0009]|nr:hypothetical protein A3715_10485 [Oleiphilus sp. HI0009]